MANSRVIYISNDDKDIEESKSNSDYICYLKERISVQESTYAILKTITVCNNLYNVRDASYGTASNNTFVFSELAPPATFAVTLSNGQYILSDFITELENKMNAVLVSGTVAITVDQPTGKLIFTCTGTQIQVFSGQNGNTAYELVGNDEKLNSILSGIVPMPYLPDLAGIQNVYIESRELAPAQGNDPSFGLINIVGQVNLSDVPFGGYGHFQANDDELAILNYKNTRNIQRIDIKIVDRQGNVMPVGNARSEISLKYFYD